MSKLTRALLALLIATALHFTITAQTGAEEIVPLLNNDAIKKRDPRGFWCTMHAPDAPGQLFCVGTYEEMPKLLRSRAFFVPRGIGLGGYKNLTEAPYTSNPAPELERQHRSHVCPPRGHNKKSLGFSFNRDGFTPYVSRWAITGAYPWFNSCR